METLPGNPVDVDDGDALAGAAEDAVLVSASNGGGSLDPRATPLDDRAAVAAFGRSFGGTGLADDVERAWSRADPRDGEAVVAAVVDISCRAPEAVEVREDASGLLVLAVAPEADPERQCLVPVTTVAVLAVPAEVL